MKSVLDRDLHFAVKYNWWSGDTSGIALETKLWYVLQRWSSEELLYVFRNFDITQLQAAYDIVKNDRFAMKERRRCAIENLLAYKKQIWHKSI